MAAYTANRLDTDEGTRCVLARLGRTRLHVTFISNNGIEHRSLPLQEVNERTKMVVYTASYLKPLPYHDGVYPVARLVRRFRAIGRERGITEAAKAELSRAAT